MNPKTVVIFGVFDGVHDGHKALIREAKLEGERLVAIVARDSEVKFLKGKSPIHDEVKRINNLLDVPDIDSVFLGDLEQGTYKMLKEVNPDIIFLGYDQKQLFESINNAIKEGILPSIEIKFGNPHNPETFKSSILNKNESTN